MSPEIPSIGNSDDIKILSFRNLYHQSTNTSGQFIESIGIDAVRIRKAYKSYGGNDLILYNLDMTVSKGTIYGLLGSSGCGKTTLLNCIIGQRQLDCGELLVFGEEPGGVPARRLGNMPQELGLCGELSIKEAIEYFGRIYNIPTDFVKSQTKMLLKLLDLPEGSRRISTLSGGQQRRVSFAITIFHEPELLILDEPTVGVDSVLRQKIWNHLIRLNREKGCTVIMTTHYLEEASQANVVALMRTGRILVEDSPEKLMSAHNVFTLDDVFVQLCVKDGGRDQKKNSSNHIEMQLDKDWKNNKVSKEMKSSLVLPSSTRLKAVFYKNSKLSFRNLGMIFVIFVLPCVALVSFFAAIGRDPQYLKLAVVNDEMNHNDYDNCKNLTDYPFSMLSCRYLFHLDKKIILQEPYSNFEEAEKAAKDGKVWGVIQFSQNFSGQLISRVQDGVNDGILETIMGSQIGISLDESNHLIKQRLVVTTIEAFENLFKEMQRAWGLEPDASTYPIKFLDSIYDGEKLSFVDFSAPAVLINLIFGNSMARIGSFIMMEREQGLFNRSLAAGATRIEMIIAHWMLQSIFLLVQISLGYLLVILVYGVYCKGSLILAIFITLLEGLSGLSFGILLSSICSEMKHALAIMIVSNVAMTIMCGMVWPLEAMPFYVRIFAYFAPSSYSVIALRNVFGRGWGLEHPEVIFGIVSSLGWIICFTLLSILITRKMNK